VVWIIHDESEERFLAELHTYPDRVAGLLGQSLVERRLSAAIKARWANIGDLFASLFAGTGPLATFSAITKIGFAIRLYGEDTYKDLQRIRKIRNAFAHQLDAQHFNVQSIRDHANNLILPRTYPISTEPVIWTQIANNQNWAWDMALDMTRHWFLTAGVVDARTRYLRTIEILAALFWYEECFARPELDAESFTTAA
jgi:hypothetical protein